MYKRECSELEEAARKKGTVEKETAENKVTAEKEAAEKKATAEKAATAEKEAKKKKATVEKEAAEKKATAEKEATKKNESALKAVLGGRADSFFLSDWEAAAEAARLQTEAVASGLEEARAAAGFKDVDDRAHTRGWWLRVAPHLGRVGLDAASVLEFRSGKSCSFWCVL